MSKLKLITLRIDSETIHRLEQLLADQTVLNTDRERKFHTRPYTQSELIRHAITAGLDVLTVQPPLVL